LLNGRDPFGAAAGEAIRKAKPANTTLAMPLAMPGQTPPASRPCAKAVGMLPFRTLNIPEGTAFDGWNNLYTYAPAPALAMSNDKTTFCALTKDTAKRGEILSLQDERRQDLLGDDFPAFVLLSHGKNGDGALLPEGRGGRTPLVNPAERENADDNLNFTDQPEGATFDDRLVWVGRDRLMAYFKTDTCREDGDKKNDAEATAAATNTPLNPNGSMPNAPAISRTSNIVIE
jgi:hypothetical protein